MLKQGGVIKRSEVMLKQGGAIKRSDADASVEQKLILDFKSYMHCIISFAYLSIFMNLCMRFYLSTMACIYCYAFEPSVCNRIELCWLAYLCSLKLLMVHEFLDDEDIIFEKCYSMDI
jgi:hypothetical protein